MAYTAPAGNVINIELEWGYAPPASDDLDIWIVGYMPPPGDGVYIQMEDGYTPPLGSAVNIILGGGEIPTTPVLAFVKLPYSFPTYIVTTVVQSYSFLLCAFVIEPYGDVPKLINVFTFWYGDAYTPIKTVIERYGNAKSRTTKHLLPWNIFSNPLSVFIEPYAITQTGLVSTIREPFSLDVYNTILATHIIPYHLLDEDTQITTDSTSVIVNNSGTLITLDYLSININAGMGQYCISCDIELPNAEQYAWCNYLDKVSVILGGTEYTFFIESRERTYTNKSVSYSIGLLSLTAKLEAPYSKTIVDNLDDGSMAQALVISMAALQNITVDWQVIDWFIPGYAISINDETPLTVIKKIVNSIGAIVQTKPNSDMLIISKYPYAVPLWSTLSPTNSFSISADILSLSETLIVKEGYNAFQITDQGSSSESINLEVVDVDSNTKIVKGYRVPFDDGLFPLETSGNPDVSIDKYVYPVEMQIPIVEDSEDPEWEIVEFIDHTGSTSLPIYEVVAYEWITEDLGDVADLGAFQVSEDGTLSVINTEAVLSESLLRIKYITKYWQWTVSGPTDRPVQFYVPEIIEE